MKIFSEVVRSSTKEPFNWNYTWKQVETDWLEDYYGYADSHNMLRQLLRIGATNGEPWTAPNDVRIDGSFRRWNIPTAQRSNEGIPI